ncbi:MAG TPA: sigma-70 family RNA polymerase sigma factor [Bryobacteraceae bacterium]
MKASTRARDEWLALRCQTGVAGALEDLIAEMEHPLFYYAIQLTGSQDRALDVLQEVWIRALRGIRKLKDPGAVRAWLYNLTHAASVDRFRKERARERAEEAHVEAAGSDVSFSAADAVEIQQALERLEPRYRAVLVLYFLEDFSLEDIARITGAPVGTVKSRLYYAKKALKDLITKGEVPHHGIQK